MIVLYTTKTCPKCGIVKAKLEAKKIEYTLVDDESILLAKGYDFLPVMEVDDIVMTSLTDINNFINKQWVGNKVYEYWT